MSSSPATSDRRVKNAVAHDTSDSRLWLSHHHGTERCVRIAGTWVCHRCLVLYPTVAVVAAVAATCAENVHHWAPAIWLLVAPMVVDWVAEHSGLISHSARRLTAVSLLAGAGGGVALAIHLEHPFALSATLPVGLAALVCLASALVATLRPQESSEDWLKIHNAEEARREARLLGLLDEESGGQDREGAVAFGEAQSN